LLNPDALKALEAIRHPAVIKGFADARLSIIQQWEASLDNAHRDELWRTLRVLANVLAIVQGEALPAQAQALTGTAENKG
jgi:hypothetical protein